MATITNRTWIKHPGAYIKEELEARDWRQRDLAFVLGMSEQAVNMILSGKRGISPDMAQALGAAFDVPGEFFANLQQVYDLAKAKAPDPSVAARRAMQSTYPVREMIKRGWLEQSDTALLESQLARFFESAPGAVPYMAHAAKKTSYEKRQIPPAQLAWLFRVRQIARSVSVPKYSEKSLRAAVAQFESMLHAPEETRHVHRALAECGVRFLVVEKLPGAKIDGVCFWLRGEPVIGMSLRFDRIDNFWFVLRHEIEHVLQKHGRDQEVLDVLDGAGVSDDVPEEERIANAAAANFCVPKEKLDSFIARKHPYYYERDVVAFARLHNRHPGIVVGQMQNCLGRYDFLTRHQVKYRTSALIGATADGWGHVAPVSI